MGLFKEPLSKRAVAMKTIRLHYPRKTLPVSVTGKWCAHNCSHCGRRYLDSMKPMAEVGRPGGIPADTESLLISGGCNESGAVPMAESLEFLKQMKASGYRLNVHTGLLPEELWKPTAELADVISFDFITDPHTIREVYNHRGSGRDYVEIYRGLSALAPVIPHITIGILGGIIRGEAEALKTLSSLGCPGLVFIVFIPTMGTRYEDCNPPELEEVNKLFCHARDLMPETPFILGCMRPRGSYGKKLEKIALAHDFGGFVNPSRELADYLKSNGYNIITEEECCSFDTAISRDRQSPGF